MRLVRLTPDYLFREFDCGDDDLNDFLVEDAKPFLDKRIANTYILEDEGRIVVARLDPSCFRLSNICLAMGKTFQHSGLLQLMPTCRQSHFTKRMASRF